jgi:MurE/MurF fusion protein
MYLGNYIKNLDKKYKKILFSGVNFNSSKIKKNNIFFAIKGNKFDGNNYINDAIKRGAKTVVTENKLELKNKDIIFIKSKNPRKLLAELSYKFINKNLKKLVAVTGTNGKSSVANFYYQILNLSKKKTEKIGKIDVQ